MKITNNCEIDTAEYCKDCYKFKPWIDKMCVEGLDPNDDRYNLININYYTISCKHADICEMWQ